MTMVPDRPDAGRGNRTDPALTVVLDQQIRHRPKPFARVDLRRSSGSWTRAVGRYHSQKARRGSLYAAKVRGAWAELRTAAARAKAAAARRYRTAALVKRNAIRRKARAARRGG